MTDLHRDLRSAYTNTPVERDAARRSLAAACARTQASPEDLRIALEAAGLLE